MPAGIARLLRLGARLRGPATSALTRVWELFAVPLPEHADYPVGALELLGRCRRKSPGWSICADLVHLRPERGTLYLVTGDALEIGASDGRALFRELEDQLADRKWRWRSFHASHAVVETPTAWRISTHPPAIVAGRDINAYLPYGSDAEDCHRVMNECQMRLHACAVNTARERSGLPAINSVWFWGSGVLPARLEATSTWDLVFTGEPLFEGMAQIVGARAAPIPDNMLTLLNRVSSGSRALLVCCTTRSLFRAPDGQVWATDSRRFDETWLSPAIRAIQAGQLQTLTVVDTMFGDMTLTARAARRWWRAWAWQRPTRKPPEPQA